MNKINFDKLITLMWNKYPCHITYHLYTKNVQVLNITLYLQLRTKDYFNILSTFSDLLPELNALTFVKFYVLMLKVKYLFLYFLQEQIKFHLPRKLRLAQIAYMQPKSSSNINTLTNVDNCTMQISATMMQKDKI